MREKIRLYTLGTRGSRPANGPEFDEFGTATSCYILKSGRYALVIDCGTGLYSAGPLLSDCEDIDVLFTHIHYDHILGLLNFSVFPKTAKVRFFAAFSGWFGKDTLREFFRAPFWPVQPEIGEIIEFGRKDKDLQLHEGITVDSYPAPHPNGASLFILHIGKKKLCIMFDCEKEDGLPFDEIKKCSLLIFDGMYTEEQYRNRVGWGHSTWNTGCRLAEKVKPKTLLITHHDPEHTDEMLRGFEHAAQEIYPDTRFARIGDVYDI